MLESVLKQQHHAQQQTFANATIYYDKERSMQQIVTLLCKYLVSDCQSFLVMSGQLVYKN